MMPPRRVLTSDRALCCIAWGSALLAAGVLLLVVLGCATPVSERPGPRPHRSPPVVAAPMSQASPFLGWGRP